MGWNNQVVNLIILTEQTSGFSGMFGYSPAPGAGKLIFSVSASAGTDPYGNAYPAGLSATQGSFSGDIQAASIANTVLTGSTFSGGTASETSITFDSGGGTLLVYATTQHTQSFTSGTGNWTAPATVTSVKAECWAAGGGGGAYGVGAGGGEYAAELTLAVTAGNNYAYSVGAAGSGGIYQGNSATSGGNTPFAGDSVTVTAHGGMRGTGNTPGAGGAGSTNAVHSNGGGGGLPGGTVVPYTSGGGGGGAAGEPGAGGQGGMGQNSVNSSGIPSTPGGTAGTGGGAGGTGAGSGDLAGGTGGAPGGGGGGGFQINATPTVNGGPGGAGKVTLTWSTAKSLVASISPAAGTDSLSNAYPEGIMTDHSYLIPVGGVPSTPAANCVLYYKSGTLYALGPSGVPLSIGAT